MTDKERLIRSIKKIEEYLDGSSYPSPRIGDALHVCECILANLEHQDVIETQDAPPRTSAALILE